MSKVEVASSLFTAGVANILGKAPVIIYRVFIKYCVFSLKFGIFLNSASSAAALVFYLPCVCTSREKRERPEYFKIFGKNTIFHEHPVIGDK